MNCLNLFYPIQILNCISISVYTQYVPREFGKQRTPK